MIELAHLESGGIHLALFWFQEDARLNVFVVGSSQDDSFELELPAIHLNNGGLASLEPVAETERETMSDPTGEFFTELGRRGHEPMLRKATGTIRFDLVDGKSTAHWSVAVKKGDVSVSQANDEADCVLTTDRPLFDAIVGGETNAMAAVLRGEIVVEGDPELLVLFQRVFPGPAESIRRREAVVSGRSS